MNYWLVKTEPETYSWADQVKEVRSRWDGVRNALAQRYLRDMSVGDLAFFYHSGQERAIIGIIKVATRAYPDPTDPTGKYSCVDFDLVEALETPVTLAWVKQQPELSELKLVRQARLSVMPVDQKSWNMILNQSIQK